MKKILLIFLIILPFSTYSRDFCEYATLISEFLNEDIGLLRHYEKCSVRTKSVARSSNIAKHHIKKENECLIDSVECDFQNCDLCFSFTDYIMLDINIDSLMYAYDETCTDSCYNTFLKNTQREICVNNCFDTFKDVSSRDSCINFCHNSFPEDSILISMEDDCEMSCHEHNPYRSQTFRYPEIFFSNVYKTTEHISFCSVLFANNYRRVGLIYTFEFDDRNGDLRMKCIYKNYWV